MRIWLLQGILKYKTLQTSYSAPDFLLNPFSSRLNLHLIRKCYVIRFIIPDINIKKGQSRDMELFFNDANGPTHHYHILIMHIGPPSFSVSQCYSHSPHFFSLSLSRRSRGVGKNGETRKCALTSKRRPI